MPARQHYFEVLGLDAPPTDRKAVKRAYSKMLKVTRPEDDPDGFMRLRDAHDQALNILRWQAEDAAWNAENEDADAVAEISSSQPTELTSAPAPSLKPAAETPSGPGMTYGDMLPPPEPEPVSETSYAIGPTPNFDAPVSIFERAESQAPSLTDELKAILDDPKRYNDRESWNILFRKARQLDIDDYVDFEQSLMDQILNFHGYYEDHPHHDTPEKMPQKLSPSITASLFKTMSWDQVSKLGYNRGLQIEWLERRMSLRKRGADPVPIPQTNSDGTGKVWMYIIGFFILLQVIRALANV